MFKLNGHKIKELLDEYVDYSLKISKNYNPFNSKPILKPKLIENAFSFQKECAASWMKKNILELIDKKPFTSKNQFRVFQNEDVSYDLYNRIVNSKKNSSGALDAWLEKSLDSKSFCIIMNGFETWNDELSSLIAERLNIMRFYFKSNHISFTINSIVGRYDFTPVGIHKDDPFSSIVHFHLGPGVKDMYLWDDDTYNAAKNSFSGEVLTAELEKNAMLFKIKPGDAFILPPHYWHVASSKSFSMAIAVGIKIDVKDNFIIESLKHNIDINKDNLNDFFLKKNETSFHDWKIQSEDILNNIYESRHYFVKSFKSSATDISLDDYETLDYHPVFKPIVKVYDGSVYIFSRGNLRVIHDRKFVNMMTAINDFELYILKLLMSHEFNKVLDCYEIIRWLVFTGSVIKIGSFNSRIIESIKM